MNCIIRGKKVDNRQAIDILINARIKEGEPYNSDWSFVILEPTNILENILEKSFIYDTEDYHNLNYVYKPLYEKLSKIFDEAAIGFDKECPYKLPESSVK